MAFNTAEGRAEYTASGGQVLFTFPFKIYTTADILVYQTPAGQTYDDVADLLILTTDYTVVINGDNGGDMTLVSGATAGDRITIVRDLAIDRTTDYQTSGDLAADTLDADQDYQTYLVGDRKLQIDRCLQLPKSVQGTSTTMPAPVALNTLRWNAAANALENAQIAADSVFVNILNVDAMSDLIGVTNTDTETINVRGYYAINDGGGGIFNWDATANKNTANAGTIIDPSVSLALQGTGVGLGCWVRQYSGPVYLSWFGGKSGSDTANAALNASAFESAIALIAAPVNFIYGGEIDLGYDQWVFGAITLTDKCGWKVSCSDNKVVLTGAFTIEGCANFELNLPSVSASVTGTHNGIVIQNSAAERCHNFILNVKALGGFTNNITTSGDMSQAEINILMHNYATAKAINATAGGINVTWGHSIFGTFAANTGAIASFTGGNPAINDFQFETYNTVDRYDLEFINSQGATVSGLLMAYSGGVTMSGKGTLSGTLFNIYSTIAYNEASGSEWETPELKVRWDRNDGAGTNYTDGTGKTGIKTGASSPFGIVRIYKPEIGFNSTVLKAYFGGINVYNPISDAFLLQNATNVIIDGGHVELGVTGSNGVTVTGSNGNGNRFTNISFDDYGTSTVRYNLTTGGGQNSVIEDSGLSDPNTISLKGGAGSIYKRHANTIGYSYYVKQTDGTSTTGWYATLTAEATSAQLDDITNKVNTDSKNRTRQVYNTTTNKIVYATGSTAASVWVDATGATAHTPV